MLCVSGSIRRGGIGRPTLSCRERRERETRKTAEREKQEKRKAFGVPSAGLSEDLRPYNVCVQYRYVPPLSPGLVSVLLTLISCTTSHTIRVCVVRVAAAPIGAVEGLIRDRCRAEPDDPAARPPLDGRPLDGRADVVERGAIHEGNLASGRCAEA